jgi:(p)ppGpp synthase/HD superfamily hydrolase
MNFESQTVIEEKAASFARAAHESINQLRRFDLQPYFEHPARVAEILRGIDASSEVIAAAYLHDVVEDVPLESLRDLAIAYGAATVCEQFWSEVDHDSRTNKLKMIDALFGERVARLVDEVTNLIKPEDGDRAFRKQTEMMHLAQASPEAQTIKLADLIDNSNDIEKHDPDFARNYLKDKAELLKLLTKGDKSLFRRAL